MCVNHGFVAYAVYIEAVIACTFYFKTCFTYINSSFTTSEVDFLSFAFQFSYICCICLTFQSCCCFFQAYLFTSCVCYHITCSFDSAIYIQNAVDLLVASYSQGTVYYCTISICHEAIANQFIISIIFCTCRNTTLGADVAVRCVYAVYQAFFSIVYIHHVVTAHIFYGEAIHISCTKSYGAVNYSFACFNNEFVTRFNSASNLTIICNS